MGDSSAPRLDQGLGARARASGVVAGLQRDVGGAAADVVASGPGLGERGQLGVRRAGAAVPALADDLAVAAQQDAADARVGVSRRAVGGQGYGAVQEHEVALALLTVSVAVLLVVLVVSVVLGVLVVVAVSVVLAPVVVGGGLAGHLVPLARCWCASSGE